MNAEVLGHFEFWSQFRQYLSDHKIPIRLSKPGKNSSSNVVLSRSYFRLRPWRLLKNNRLGVSVQFSEPNGAPCYESLAQQRRREIDERLSRLGSLEWNPCKTSLSRPKTASKTETCQDWNAWLADAIETTVAVFNEIFPPSVPLKLEFRGEKLVNSESGEEYDVAAVTTRLPWQAQKTGSSSWEDWAPYMPPHQFVVLGKCNYADWDVLYFTCMKHPASYRAYFRGYPSPMQYWEAGDGYRYWPTALRGVMMLNRCTLDSVEPPRRVDQGARRIKPKDWGAPPWLPQGNGWPASYLKKHPDLAREIAEPIDES